MRYPARLVRWRHRLPLLLMLLVLASSISPTRAAGLPSQLLLHDIAPGLDGSAPQHLTVIGDTVLFSAAAPATGRELWRSDGTPAGTTLVADLAPGPASTEITAIQPFQGSALFLAGSTLWRSDGTPTGTLPVTTSAALQGARALTIIHDLAYFTTAATVGISVSHQLWRSDGTAAGTVPVASSAGVPSYYPSHMEPAVVDGQPHVWHTIDYGMGGANWSLYRLEGTSLVPRTGCSNSRSGRTCNGIAAWRGGLVMDQLFPIRLHFIQAGNDHDLDLRSLPITRIHALGATDQVVLFMAEDAAGTRRVWRSDGTLAGTQPILNLHARGLWTAFGFLGFGDRLYFQVEPEQGPLQLWRSDGTAAGTQPVMDLAPATTLFYSSRMAIVNERLLFEAADAAHGVELWELADPADAPHMLYDLEPGAASSVLGAGVVGLRGGLFWAGGDQAAGMEPRYLRPTFAPYLRPAWAGGAPGGRATVPLVWGNHGQVQQPVTLTLTLTPEIQFVGHSLPVGATVAGPTVTWALPGIPTGEQQVQFTVQLPDAPRGTTYTATLRLDPGGSSVPLRLVVAHQIHLPTVQQAAPVPPAVPASP